MVESQQNLLKVKSVMNLLFVFALNVLMKDITSAKHKLRNIWDMVIQGNVREMESSTKRAFKEIEKCDASFLHLFRQFPNNRFVVRQYARFAKEILADHVLAEEMIEKMRMLQRGFTINVDQTHEKINIYFVFTRNS